MSQVSRWLSDPVLDAVRWIQTNYHVRAAESAFVAVFLGGFYLVAFLRIIGPYSKGPTYELLTSVSPEIQVLLTVVGPFFLVVLEWLAGLAILRDQPGYEDWNLEQRAYVWLEVITVVFNIPTTVYFPLAPVAFFWTLVLFIQPNPFWVIPAAIFVLDVVALAASNRFMQYRHPENRPPEFSIERVGHIVDRN